VECVFGVFGCFFLLESCACGLCLSVFVLLNLIVRCECVLVEWCCLLNGFVLVCLCWDGVCVLLCCEGVCFGGLCVVCVLVLSKLMVSCALCWGILLPRCCCEFC